jgi:AcrR family transcriptional regulator
MIKEKQNTPTRERILSQAEILFAQKGFHAVSVREITTAADSNLAAVNYHFGNKKNLYLCVFREKMSPRADIIRGYFESILSKKENPGIGDIFGALGEAFLGGPMTDAERKMHIDLMHREMSHPTEAFKLIVEEEMKPFYGDLIKQLKSSMAEAIDEDRMMLSILSMLAITFYFNNAREHVTQITGHKYDDEFKTILVNYIAAFSEKGFLAAQKEEKE